MDETHRSTRSHTAAVAMRDVARIAGVSRATVSNVLNSPERVAEDTRARVTEVIEQLGFVRNEQARQLRAGTSTTLAFIVLDSSNPFFTDVARGADLVARDESCFLLTANSNGDHAKELAYLGLFGSQRVQGILVSAAGEVIPTLRRLRSQGIPSVLVDSPADSAGDFSSVGTDNVAGGMLAMDHLLETGRSRPVFVGGPETLHQVADRLEGARRSLRAHRLNPRDLATYHGTSSNEWEGRRIGEYILGLSPEDRPDSIVATNDLLALGLLNAFLADGSARVPDDIAIVGYDDIPAASSAIVPLTSIRQPSALIGEIATRLLIEEASASEEQHREQLLFPPELVIRTSTAVD